MSLDVAKAKRRLMLMGAVNVAAILAALAAAIG